MKTLLGVVALFAVVIGSLFAWRALRHRDEAEPRPEPVIVRADDPAAVAALEKSGAEFERDNAQKGRPVVGLTLRGAGIDDALMKHIAGLPRLRSLTLNGARITDAGLKSLATLEALESLSLD